jgi:GNAT superfamily N-acetyltransferase
VTDGLLIRPAVEADAEVIAQLANQLSRHEGLGDEIFSGARVREDGFGDDPAFCVVLAELAGEVVGYALYQDFYNSDPACRGLWLSDLFVVDGSRGRRIGRRLLADVARRAVKKGACCLWWGVRAANHRARAFYAALGARDEDARILELDRAALEALASRT